MANFDIQYNFIAIDKFSEVAKRVQKQAAKIAKTMGQSTKGLNVNAQTLMKTSKHVEKTAKNLNNLGNVTERTAIKTQKGMGKIATSVTKGGRALTKFTEQAAAWGDKMAFKGYMQFMNIGFPILLAGKLGMTYADQVERANLQMSTLFGKQKNYAGVSKEISGQAQTLSKHSRFTAAEIKATSAHIGVMTNNLRLSRDLTPLSLRYAAIQGVDPQQAADKLLQAIKVGGAVSGTGMVLPKGMGSAMAQTRYKMLQSQLGGQLKGVLAKDVETTTAQLHRMTGQLQELTGTIMVQAAPALTSMAKGIGAMLKPIIGFLDKHPGFSGKLAQGSLAALALVTGVTILGAAVSAIVMPFEILIKTFEVLKIAAVAAGISQKALAASEVEAGAAGRSGAIKRWGSRFGLIGLAAGATYMAGQGYKSIHAAAGAKMASLQQRKAAGDSSVPAFTMMPAMAGGFMTGMPTAIIPMAAPAHHKVNLDINVNHAGNVDSANATTSSHNVSLGVNMRHAHG